MHGKWAHGFGLQRGSWLRRGESCAKSRGIVACHFVLLLIVGLAIEVAVHARKRVASQLPLAHLALETLLMECLARCSYKLHRIHHLGTHMTLALRVWPRRDQAIDKFMVAKVGGISNLSGLLTVRHPLLSSILILYSLCPSLKLLPYSNLAKKLL